MNDNFLDEFESNVKKLLKQPVKDIHAIRLPSKKEWNKLVDKMKKKIHGWSAIVVEKDGCGINYAYVYFRTDKATKEIKNKIEEIEGISAVEDMADGIAVVADFCPLCSVEVQDEGIKNMNLVPILLNYNKALKQLQGKYGS